MVAIAFIIAFIIILSIIVFTYSRSSPSDHSSQKVSSNQREITVMTLDEPEDMIDGSFTTSIAGITYHCDKTDIGGFIGVVAPDPDNKYNKNAMAIYRNDTKLLGYIPESQLNEYRIWSDCKPFTCVGYIEPGDQYPIHGKVKIIKPYNSKYVEDETRSYILWLRDKKGNKFIPKNYQL